MTPSFPTRRPADLDVRRGMADDARELPANWARMGKDDVRAAGLDPALMHDAKSGFDASFYRNAQGEVVLAFTGTDEGRDWKHNFGQGLGRKDDQYDRADRKSTRLNSSH